MTRATAIKIDRPLSEPKFCMGPAEILTVSADQVGVKLGSGEVARAKLALAFVYQPAIGDSALVVGDGSAYYVIGILSGSGKTTLDLPGDVDIRAEGKLRLLSNEAVEINAPTVKLAAGKVEMLAGAVVQSFRSLRLRVAELVSTHAGEAHTVIAGASRTQSKSAAIVAQEKVSINGREVHLG